MAKVNRKGCRASARHLRLDEQHILAASWQLSSASHKAFRWPNVHGHLLAGRCGGRGRGCRLFPQQLLVLTLLSLESIDHRVGKVVDADEVHLPQLVQILHRAVVVVQRVWKQIRTTSGDVGDRRQLWALLDKIAQNGDHRSLIRCQRAEKMVEHLDVRLDLILARHLQLALLLVEHLLGVRVHIVQPASLDRVDAMASSELIDRHQRGAVDHLHQPLLDVDLDRWPCGEIFVRQTPEVVDGFDVRNLLQLCLWLIKIFQKETESFEQSIVGTSWLCLGAGGSVRVCAHLATEHDLDVIQLDRTTGLACFEPLVERLAARLEQKSMSGQDVATDREHDVAALRVQIETLEVVLLG